MVASFKLAVDFYTHISPTGITEPSCFLIFVRSIELFPDVS
ncbi:hypothetical protein EVA_18346 [gut metagenome]|uniref:Uncharacterized protein n=1 Tax=gut metagenome TaxID=749906 RepID=J9FVG8_9ZZZZ